MDPLEPHRTYLDLAMREYLEMRTELFAHIRMNVTVTAGAFGALGVIATVVVVSPKDALTDESRGLVLLVVASFLAAVAIGVMASLNAFRIIEAYLLASARNIREIVAGSKPQATVRSDPLLSFQEGIERFNANPTAPRWIFSYGLVSLMSIALSVFEVLLLAYGYSLGVSPNPFAVKFVSAAFWIALVMTLAMVVSMIYGATHPSGWDLPAK